MTDKARLDFIRIVLQSAPAGQFQSMLNDIQTLNGAPLDQALLNEIQHQHETQTCSRTTGASNTEHPLASDLLAQLQETSSKNESVISRQEIVAGESSNAFVVRTYAERIDENNCRTGYWTAEWMVQTKSGSSQQADLSGHVSICAFSFEDGNVQLRSTQEFAQTSLSVTDNNDTPLSKMIQNQISEWEHEIFIRLQESSNSIRLGLKNIRGILPMTHTRLNWSLVTKRTVRNLQETVGN